MPVPDRSLDWRYPAVIVGAGALLALLAILLAWWSKGLIKDAARACVMSVESTGWTGHHRFFLNADDTMIDVPTADAIAQVYPDVPVREPLEGFAAPLSTRNVKKLIGWTAEYSWRDERFAS